MLINFSKLTFSKNSIRDNIRVSNSLGTAQARPFVRPGLVPICLQKLSIDDTSRQIWVLLHRHLRNLARAFSTCMLRLTAFAVVFNIAYASNHAPWRNAQARARPVQKIEPKLNKQSRQSPIRHFSVTPYITICPSTETYFGHYLRGAMSAVSGMYLFRLLLKIIFFVLRSFYLNKQCIP